MAGEWSLAALAAAGEHPLLRLSQLEAQGEETARRIAEAQEHTSYAQEEARVQQETDAATAALNAMTPAQLKAIRAELDRLWSVYAAVIRPELNPPQGR